MLHAALVRSPAAHARIRSTCRAASAAPGVLLILNGADLLQLLPPVPEGQIPMPSKWSRSRHPRVAVLVSPLLAGRARWERIVPPDLRSAIGAPQPISSAVESVAPNYLLAPGRVPMPGGLAESNRAGQ